MKSVAELAIVRFKGRWHEQTKSGLHLQPEFAVNNLDYAQTEATVVALPDHYGDFPSTLKVGDTVVCEYGAMDDKNPLEIEGEGLCFHVHLSEIIYKKHSDGRPEMQHGWVLGRGLPVPKPEWAKGTETINNIVYWTNEFGHAIEKVDFSGQKNKMKVFGFGLPKPSLGEIPYKLGDIVAMLPECEFTNHGNNEILGNKFWFVRQEDIVGVIKQELFD